MRSHCSSKISFSHSQDCYIADQRGSSVMVWKGKQASKEERREALNRAVVSSRNKSPLCSLIIQRYGSLRPGSPSWIVIIYQRHLSYQGFIKAKNYPSSTSVKVMCEGGESAMFKHLFKSWRDKGQTQGLGTTYNVGKIGNLYLTCNLFTSESESCKRKWSNTPMTFWH